jgi:hypothetical protein
MPFKLEAEGIVFGPVPPFATNTSLKVLELPMLDMLVVKKLLAGEVMGDSMATEMGVELRLRERRDSLEPLLPLFLLLLEGIVL